MSASRNGPRTTMQTSPAFHIGCVADLNAYDLMRQNAMKGDSNVAIIAKQSLEPASFNIWAGDLLANVDDELKRRLNKFINKKEGRTAVVAQVAGLPFTKEGDTSVKAMTDEQKKLELLKHLVFVGVAQTRYTHDPSSVDHTPHFNGMQVQAFGPTTIRVPVGKPIPPMTPICLDIDPSYTKKVAGNYRSFGRGPERAVLTIKEWNGKAPTNMALNAIMSVLNASGGTPPTEEQLQGGLLMEALQKVGEVMSSLSEMGEIEVQDEEGGTTTQKVRIMKEGSAPGDFVKNITPHIKTLFDVLLDMNDANNRKIGLNIHQNSKKDRPTHNGGSFQTYDILVRG